MKPFLIAHAVVNGGALYIKATIKMNTTGIWIGGYVQILEVQGKGF
jgi:hypothetical protein